MILSRHTAHGSYITKMAHYSIIPGIYYCKVHIWKLFDATLVYNGERNLQSYDCLIILAFKCDFVQHSSLNRGVKTCLPHPVATVVNENIRTTTTYFLCCNNIRIQAINIGVRMMTKGMLIQCIVLKKRKDVLNEFTD